MNPSNLLSILIPVYNWNIAPLLKRLNEQCIHLPDESKVEIIVVDDGSTEKFSNSLEAEKLSLVRYHELDENTGRSAVRNYLLNISHGKYVLFLDADMLPDQDTFVQTYCDKAMSGREIVCGGISYLQYQQRDPATSFYLYKSQKSEAVPAVVREKTPWRYLFTSNILIRRDIIEKNTFDQRFSGYGYEDIEWGIRLAKSYTIEHVDNTCTHFGVMSKEQVFLKMRESISNYSFLRNLHPEETSSVGAVRYSNLMRYFPDSLLSFADTLLKYLYFHVSWNTLLFIVFQSDKVVLLAKQLKKQQEAGSG